MKQFALLVLVLALSGICYINGYLVDNKASETLSPSADIRSAKTGAGKISGRADKNISSYYSIKARLDTQNKIVKCEEEITWQNNTDIPAKEVFLHLKPNSLKNSRTVFAAARGLSVDAGTSSFLAFDDVRLNGSPWRIEYVNTGARNRFDSTVAVIKLPEECRPGQSVSIRLTFRLKIPRSITGFGYASGRNYFQLTDWLPKTAIFRGGRWICSPRYGFADDLADFGRYDVRLTLPADYILASGGQLKKKTYSKDRHEITYDLIGQSAHDFSAIACDEFIEKRINYKSSEGHNIVLFLYMQPENITYSDRYIKAAKNALDFMEKNIGPYPFESFSIADVPKTSLETPKAYTALATVRADLFSPEETRQPERQIVKGLVRQYFSSAVSVDRMVEPWLDEGISTYITNLILSSSYGPAYLSFRLFGHYPIMGINILSYNEIPLIYTLGEFENPPEAELLSDYYLSPTLVALSDTACRVPDEYSYRIISSAKPVMMLYSLGKYLGFTKTMRIFRDYYSRNLFSMGTSEDFFASVENQTGSRQSWFFDNMYSSSSKFDYRISSVRQTSPGRYEVMAERINEGILRSEIALYTEKDTLLRIWNGSERWRKFHFTTGNEVLGAEIDPFRKNLMDLNFANNSYMVHKQYGGSVSISLRWFFWIQNLFLILGSIA